MIDFYRELNGILLVLIILLYIYEIYTSKKNKIIYYLIVIFCLTLVILKPYGTYPDDNSYLELYYDFLNNSLSHHNQGRDYIYYYLVFLFGWFTTPENSIIAISVISILIKSRVIGVISSHSIGPLLFLYSYSLQLIDLTALRSALAAAFIFLVLQNLLVRNKIKVIINYLFAIGSHLTAIFTIPIFLCNRYAIFRYSELVTLSILVFAFFQPKIPIPYWLEGQYSNLYINIMNSGLYDDINIFRLSNLTLIFFIFLLKKILIKKEFGAIFFLGSLISQLSILLFYSFPVFATRLSEIYLPFFFVMIAYIHDDLKNYHKYLLAFISFALGLNYLFINPLFLRDF